MDWLTPIFLFYSFISLYFLSLYFLICISNYRKFFSYSPLKKVKSLSIVVPCYNKESTIGRSLEKLLKVKYPGLKKIIVVDDCSTDNSYSIIRSYAKKHKIIKIVRTPSNTGRAAGAKNYGAKFVKTELIGFMDADSYVSEDALEKMVGFFDNPRVAGVTPLILVYNRKGLLERLQAIEYKIIGFTRRLLNFVEGVYVTPGPLAIYRKSVFEEIGGFDEKNITEDIEITWKIISKGYFVQMSPLARVYTVVPTKFKEWFKQRVRWNLGGLQSIIKYRRHFLKRGMLGVFVLPLFVFNWAIGIMGLGILIYRIVRTLAIRYLSTYYSIEYQTTILRLNDINLMPNVLIFFGAILLVFSLTFTLFALSKFSEKEFKKHGILDILLYMFVYLLTYPVILLTSAINYLLGKEKW